VAVVRNLLAREEEAEHEHHEREGLHARQQRQPAQGAVLPPVATRGGGHGHRRSSSCVSYGGVACLNRMMGLAQKVWAIRRRRVHQPLRLLAANAMKAAILACVLWGGGSVDQC